MHRRKHSMLTLSQSDICEDQYYNSYKMSENSYCHSCDHQQEILFLQHKLSETHQKLIQQIEITKQKELELISLKQTTKHANQRNDADHTIFSSNTSEEALSQKIWLLQENLEAMRKKVMQEIKEKKDMKKKMAEQTAKYELELKQQKEKFEGLEIIYFRLLQDSNHKENTSYKQNSHSKSALQNTNEINHKQEEKPKGYIKSVKEAKENDKMANKSQNLGKENRQRTYNDYSKCNYESDEENERGSVLRQIQEVKNNYKRQNQLALAKEKQDHDKFRKTNRNAPISDL